MKMHIALILTGLADLETDELGNVKAELTHWDDHISSYLDDGKGGRTVLTQEQVVLMQLTAGQLLVDAIKHKVTKAVDELATDVTLQSTAKGGDA